MFEQLKADLENLAEGREFWVEAQLVAFNAGFHSVILYRFSRWLRGLGLGPLASFVTYVNALITGAQISSRADIGKGLVIYHPHGMVIGGPCVIGRNCTLVHCNLIGQLEGGGDRPAIGDNFLAGAGAKILGRITIGDNVRVIPNAVVMRDVPDNVTVSGIPARIIHDRRTGAVTPARVAQPAGVFQRLMPLLPTVIDASAATPSTRLLGGGVGLDSIEILRLACAVEEEFGITIDEADLRPEHFHTVGALADFITQQ